MRNEFEELSRNYPGSIGWRNSTFAAHPLADLLTSKLPSALQRAVPELTARYEVAGSAGKGDWTHTPWVAVLDKTETSSVQEGVYIVYLLSHGGERLYLTINQGCTRLKNLRGRRDARSELIRRREVMWERVREQAVRLGRVKMDLNVASTVWRGKLYEAGTVVGIEYSTASLPPDRDMANDLKEAIALYHMILREGSWVSDDEIERQALDDDIYQPLIQAKRYRHHRSIERKPSHSRRVKKILGTCCMGCGLTMEAIYGEKAKGMIDVHHLTPLSSLEDEITASFDPKTDFAVLCPSCHRAIHRLPDVSDLTSLRESIGKGVLGKLSGLN